MLKIVNDLSLFFEDCYREFSVREYSRLNKMSPPTASKLLKYFVNEELLLMKEFRGHLLFRVNRESLILRDLSRIYWREKLKDLVDYLNLELRDCTIVLFGSLSKLESKEDSDVDLAIFRDVKKKVDINKFEKKLGREIQLIWFDSVGKIPNNIKKNILNGYLLNGGFK